VACTAGSGCTNLGTVNVTADKVWDVLGVAYDSGTVFFFGAATEGGTQTLGSCPAAGCSGAATILNATGNAPGSMTARAGQVAWLDSLDKSVVVFSTAGQSAKQIYTGPIAPTALAIDEASAYFIAGDTILVAPLAGGNPSTLATGQAGARGIAVHDNAVYWTVPNAIMCRAKK
jgi:hypothetical protein